MKPNDVWLILPSPDWNHVAQILRKRHLKIQVYKRHIPYKILLAPWRIPSSQTKQLEENGSKTHAVSCVVFTSELALFELIERQQGFIFIYLFTIIIIIIIYFFGGGGGGGNLYVYWLPVAFAIVHLILRTKNGKMCVPYFWKALGFDFSLPLTYLLNSVSKYHRTAWTLHLLWHLWHYNHFLLWNNGHDISMTIGG